MIEYSVDIMDSDLPQSSFQVPPQWLCRLPQKDPWSTPFAECLLTQLDTSPGLAVLDVACGDGIPAFVLANQVGPSGRVLGVDCQEAQLVRARAIQGPFFPWLTFRQGDIRSLPQDFGLFDRITGNLSFMFFRPDRPKALANLIQSLKPGGQLVLTFPSLGTFDSLWKEVEASMVQQGLNQERSAFLEYVAERPSAADCHQWLRACGLERVEVKEYPLEVHTGPGDDFLFHPLLRGGFLDDVYECFSDPIRADQFMREIAANVEKFLPLLAQRCVMAGWLPGNLVS